MSWRLTGVALAALALSGHDLYLVPGAFFVSPGERITLGIHNGDSFPESEVAPVLARLRDASLITPDAVYNVTNLLASGKAVVGQTNIRSRGTLILAVRTVPHVLELPVDQFRAYLKEEGLTRVLLDQPDNRKARERYGKYAKALIVSGAPDGFYAHPAGLEIEIIPEKDPYALRGSGELPVRVLLRGKPAADLQLETARAREGAAAEVRIVGRTDADGRLAVPINGAGRWRLHAVAMERCADASMADWESYWASLTFEVRGEKK